MPPSRRRPSAAAPEGAVVPSASSHLRCPLAEKGSFPKVTLDIEGGKDPQEMGISSSSIYQEDFLDCPSNCLQTRPEIRPSSRATRGSRLEWHRHHVQLKVRAAGARPAPLHCPSYRLAISPRSQLLAALSALQPADVCLRMPVLQATLRRSTSKHQRAPKLFVR